MLVFFTLILLGILSSGEQHLSKVVYRFWIISYKANKVQISPLQYGSAQFSPWEDVESTQVNARMHWTVDSKHFISSSLLDSVTSLSLMADDFLGEAQISTSLKPAITNNPSCVLLLKVDSVVFRWHIFFLIQNVVTIQGRGSSGANSKTGHVS